MTHLHGTARRAPSPPPHRPRRTHNAGSGGGARSPDLARPAGRRSSRDAGRGPRRTLPQRWRRPEALGLRPGARGCDAGWPPAGGPCRTPAPWRRQWPAWRWQERERRGTTATGMWRRPRPASRSWRRYGRPPPNPSLPSLLRRRGGVRGGGPRRRARQGQLVLLSWGSGQRSPDPQTDGRGLSGGRRGPVLGGLSPRGVPRSPRGAPRRVSALCPPPDPTHRDP